MNCTCKFGGRGGGGGGRGGEGGDGGGEGGGGREGGGGGGERGRRGGGGGKGGGGEGGGGGFQTLPQRTTILVVGAHPKRAQFSKTLNLVYCSHISLYIPAYP